MIDGLSNASITKLRRLPSVRVIPGYFLPIIILLVSCSKEPQTAETIKIAPDDPAMSAKNIEVFFSDSGKVQVKLTSPLMNRYSGESPYTEFPDGFKVFMFDSLNHVTSTITGNRGRRSDLARIMEAWGNVVVRNEIKNEQMNTEHLIWDENRHKIFSDVKVKIIRPDQVLSTDKSTPAAFAI